MLVNSIIAGNKNVVDSGQMSRVTLCVLGGNLKRFQKVGLWMVFRLVLTFFPTVFEPFSPFLCHKRGILGPKGDLGVTLDHFLVGPGSFWITLGSFWHRFGIVLGSLWCPLSNSGSSPCSSFVLAASKRPQAGLVSFVCCGCVFFREILSGTFCCTFFGRLRNSNAIFVQGHNKHFAEQEKNTYPSFVQFLPLTELVPSTQNCRHPKS